MKRVWQERLAALLIMAAGAYWLQQSYRFGELSALFPRVISLIMLVLAAVWFASTLVKAIAGATAQGVTDVHETVAERRRAAYQSLVVIVWLVVWTALVPVIGLLLASFVGVTGLTLAAFWGTVGTRRSVLLALVVVWLFYLTFRFLVHVPFPLPFWR